MRGKRVKHDRILANELYDAGVRYNDGAGQNSRKAFIRRFRHRKHRH